MIAFSCPTCHKKLTIQEVLAGKKVRCPGCGQTMIVPAAAAVSSSAEGTLPLAPPAPAGGHDDPPRPSISEAPTQAPSSDLDATEGVGRPEAGRNPRLTEFLTPPQSDDELGRLGKYRILKILGHGGMGVVFLAEDPKLKRKVAIKAMLPAPALAAGASAGLRFLREAQAMAAVKHDHIATIHQVDEERGVPFLAMEFLAGEPLDSRLKREGKLPPTEVLRIGREIAEGLEAAHAGGLIHRDIKPANVWLEAPRGRVKILDFGLARAATQDAGLTQEGAIVGTPSYMAPEQACGKPVDARCDLFSLGCVLYRLCTGQQAFRGTDTISTLLAVAGDQPPAPTQLVPELPQPLSDLVMKLLEKEPARRPASAGEVAESLRAMEAKAAGSRVSAGDTVALPSGSVAAGARGGRRRKLLVLAACLLALLLGGGWLAMVLLRVETAKGTLIVELDGTETEARIKNGKVVLTRPDGKALYTLSPSERNRELPAGAYRVRVEGADGLTLDTPEFTLKKGETAVVRVRAEPKAVAQAGDPDRRVAEWVLSIGGSVQLIGERNVEVSKLAALPQESFRLTGVYLDDNKQVSDEDLVRLKECKNLTLLSLPNTKVSDVGLAHFQGRNNLDALNLSGTKVTDAGLAYFRDRKRH
jgi:predicted RNA-binding Zn-ribbon protein involved in translation (DUF1610 family)